MAKLLSKTENLLYFVVFYTNNLADTPRVRMEGQSSHALRYVHGLPPIRRWLGNETFNRIVLIFPSIFVCYNVFMNGVDPFDQF